MANPPLTPLHQGGDAARLHSLPPEVQAVISIAAEAALARRCRAASAPAPAGNPPEGRGRHGLLEQASLEVPSLARPKTQPIGRGEEHGQDTKKR